MPSREWLHSLNKGDKVIKNAEVIQQLGVYSIKRISQKYIYLTDGTKFSRYHGYQAGKGALSIWLAPYGQREQEEIEKLKGGK